MGLGGWTTMYPSVPRSGPSGARKRCASPKENWEAQKRDYMKREEFKYQGQEFAEEIIQTIDDQWKYAPPVDSAPAGGVPVAAPPRGLIPPPPSPQPAEIPPGGSSGSWTVVEEVPEGHPDAPARNKNRHAAPIDWEADEGQERGGVMVILGGRK